MSASLESAGINRKESILKIANLNPVYSTETEKISDVAYKMIKRKHKRIPIVNKNEEVIGIVAATDVFRAFLQQTNFNSKVTTMMTKNVVFANADDSIASVLQKMKISRRGFLPVVRARRLVATVSERDIAKNFSDVNFNVTISNLMASKPFVVKPNITISDCLRSMVNVHYRRLPVVDGKKLVGIVTSTDVLNFLTENNFSDNNIRQEVHTITTKNPVKVGKSLDISEAVKKMVLHDVGGLIVSDNDKLEGIITERDIIEEIV